jgi:hypothetical protein
MGDISAAPTLESGPSSSAKSQDQQESLCPSNLSLIVGEDGTVYCGHHTQPRYMIPVLILCELFCGIGALVSLYNGVLANSEPSKSRWLTAAATGVVGCIRLMVILFGRY